VEIAFTIGAHAWLVTNAHFSDAVMVLQALADGAAARRAENSHADTR
jgi:hypothetical protein